MKISDKDILALNEQLSFKLNQMRIYHSLTIALLNNEIDQYNTFLDERQHIIDEVNAADLRIKRCLTITEDASLNAVAQALRGQDAKLVDERLNGAFKLAKQIHELVNDIAIIDKKLMLKAQENRNSMIEELKGMSGQRRMVDTLYFTAKNAPIGNKYDIKK